jgi:hypothetical protein
MEAGTYAAFIVASIEGVFWFAHRACACACVSVCSVGEWCGTGDCDDGE